jgi:hypothetical protein
MRALALPVIEEREFLVQEQENYVANPGGRQF